MTPVLKSFDRLSMKNLQRRGALCIDLSSRDNSDELTSKRTSLPHTLSPKAPNRNDTWIIAIITLFP
ncbi:uncharacterized protein PHALS_03855 [Plasmopara halstedii]|uniref:Uncharacterized protein n=1 Tax=Plasmopara halstedii TaxID=4781 RepID=A0A0P1B106_PLAHL|nr:uncharacterized protein PHALS_03855 [Plasmopara halstedii]CEG47207.1 hypothetical protein PHALS_03855 [Plasmopara halstedii]|eukprot:XP_024583576.1 hypothetical protein PHALS_03855 [Plasmopara halstedii]